MKNILMISPIYPGNGTPKGYTPVVHYFTKEWVKMGYNVRVIHTSAYYPQIFYMAPKWIRNIIENQVGITLPSEQINNEGEYILDGVSVYRIAVKKTKPHGKYSQNVLEELCEKCQTYLNRIDYYPDVIISHWMNPTAFLMHYLKQIYHCPTTMVLHGGADQINLFPNATDIFKSIDIWGYRAEKTRLQFERQYGVPKMAFRCYSGIPSNCVCAPIVRDWSNVNRYVFVGQLINRKYPDCVIDAIATVEKDKNYSFHIVGEGAMDKKLQKQVLYLKQEKKIVMHGRVPRLDVVGFFNNSDIFIMISRYEVFGLVYLEAMSRGCITIASKGEGMEGIIKDGINGFLCEAGNTKELISIIQRIKTMSPQQLTKISQMGRETALLLTDFNVAKDYIETVKKYSMEITSANGQNDIQHYHSLI